METASSGAAARRLQSFGHDLLASVVVFFVALPLCMGIAIASGVPAENAAAVGIITGVIGGLVVGIIGGSPFQVSGPAAGLSVIVFELIQEHGWERVGVIVLLAGGMQVLAGLFKLGQWFRAVSPAVIHGMLAGIGILIFAGQFHIMVDDQPRGNGLANLMSLPEAFWKGVIPAGDVTHDDAARIGLLTIGVIAFWKSLAPKKLKVIPAPLLAIAIATAATVLLELPIKLVMAPDDLLGAVRFPDWDELGWLADWQPIAVAALAMAFIASAETLLCASAVDQMHQGPRTRYDRELAAQGVGNMLCGLVGALPMTGVIVRSAANVEAGARSRAAAVLHGCWLLVFVCLCPFILRWIPTAGLAAILVFTGYKLVNPAAVKALSSYGRGEVIIYVATVITIVAADLLTGVLVGIGLALAKMVHALTHFKVRLRAQPERNRTELVLFGAATFLKLPKLAATLEAIPSGTELHVHLEELTYIDHACLDLLMNWEKQHEATGGKLVVDWDSLTAKFHSRGKRNRSRSESVA